LRFFDYELLVVGLLVPVGVLVVRGRFGVGPSSVVRATIVVLLPGGWVRLVFRKKLLIAVLDPDFGGAKFLSLYTFVVSNVFIIKFGQVWQHFDNPFPVIRVF
jgi:hypothetical protein